MLVESAPMDETGLCDIFCVLWCFPCWGSLFLCSGWWNWISSLWRAGQCPVLGFGVSIGSVWLWAVFLALTVLDMSISTATSKWPSQHIFTASSPKLVTGIFASCFCFLVPPFTAGQILLDRGLCRSFLDSLTVSSVHGYVCGLLSAPWACPLCCRAYVLLFQLTRPNISYISFYLRIQLMKWKSPIIETILECEYTRLK